MSFFIEADVDMNDTMANKNTIEMILYTTDKTSNSLTKKIESNISTNDFPEKLIVKGKITHDIQNLIFESYRKGNMCKAPEKALWRSSCVSVNDAVLSDHVLKVESFKPMSTRSKKLKPSEKRTGTLEESHIIILARKDKNIYGFITLKEKENALYIDLICTGKTRIGDCRIGTLLLNSVYSVANFLNFERIELNALDYVMGTNEECKNKRELTGLIDYYKSFGFETNGDPQDDEQPMFVEISNFIRKDPKCF